jgi:hypothetical protein
MRRRRALVAGGVDGGRREHVLAFRQAVGAVARRLLTVEAAAETHARLRDRERKPRVGHRGQRGRRRDDRRCRGRLRVDRPAVGRCHAHIPRGVLSDDREPMCAVGERLVRERARARLQRPVVAPALQRDTRFGV